MVLNVLVLHLGSLVEMYPGVHFPPAGTRRGVGGRWPAAPPAPFLLHFTGNR
jgi:hypothetical protein